MGTSATDLQLEVTKLGKVAFKTKFKRKRNLRCLEDEDFSKLVV